MGSVYLFRASSATAALGVLRISRYFDNWYAHPSPSKFILNLIVLSSHAQRLASSREETPESRVLHPRNLRELLVFLQLHIKHPSHGVAAPHPLPGIHIQELIYCDGVESSSQRLPLNCFPTLLVYVRDVLRDFLQTRRERHLKVQ